MNCSISRTLSCRPWRLLAATAAAIVLGTSCQAILGIEEGHLRGAGGSGGAGLTAGSGGTPAGTTTGTGGGTGGIDCTGGFDPAAESQVHGSDGVDVGFSVAFGGGRIAVVGSFAGAAQFGSQGSSDTFAPPAGGADDAFVVWYDETGGFIRGRALTDEEGYSPNDQQAHDVAIHEGSTYVVGDFHESISFGGTAQDPTIEAIRPGASEGFLVKLAPDGVPEWSVHLHGGAEPESSMTVSAVTVDADGSIWAAGQFRGTLSVSGYPAESSVRSHDTAFVARFGPNGVLEAKLEIPTVGVGQTSSAHELAAILGTSDVVVGGSFTGSLELPTDSYDAPGPGQAAWLTRLAVSEATLTNVNWPTLTFGNAGETDLTGLAVSTTGEVVVSGRFTGAEITIQADSIVENTTTDDGIDTFALFSLFGGPMAWRLGRMAVAAPLAVGSGCDSSDDETGTGDYRQ